MVVVCGGGGKGNWRGAPVTAGVVGAVVVVVIATWWRRRGVWCPCGDASRSPRSGSCHRCPSPSSGPNPHSSRLFSTVQQRWTAWACSVQSRRRVVVMLVERKALIAFRRLGQVGEAARESVNRLVHHSTRLCLRNYDAPRSTELLERKRLNRHCRRNPIPSRR